jgi:hypothetical protein
MYNHRRQTTVVHFQSCAGHRYHVRSAHRKARHQIIGGEPGRTPEQFQRLDSQ